MQCCSSRVGGHGLREQCSGMALDWPVSEALQGTHSMSSCSQLTGKTQDQSLGQDRRTSAAQRQQPQLDRKEKGKGSEPWVVGEVARDETLFPRHTITYSLSHIRYRAVEIRSRGDIRDRDRILHPRHQLLIRDKPNILMSLHPIQEGDESLTNGCRIGNARVARLEMRGMGVNAKWLPRSLVMGEEGVLEPREDLGLIGRVEPYVLQKR